ncbi:MAG: hypothetical protein BWY62_01421 [Firmicutes bacterium ADurb.Bin356]|nr:MAG: hypothetical protein BWY62_01421 [Firmicutes bacterium ADurb.Bin356]
MTKPPNVSMTLRAMSKIRIESAILTISSMSIMPVESGTMIISTMAKISTAISISVNFIVSPPLADA